MFLVAHAQRSDNHCLGIEPTVLDFAKDLFGEFSSVHSSVLGSVRPTI
jgi:hypothetical protein